MKSFSSFSSKLITKVQAQLSQISQKKQQGLTIREKKLQIKYKQLIQKHKTLRKLEQKQITNQEQKSKGKRGKDRKYQFFTNKDFLDQSLIREEQQTKVYKKILKAKSIKSELESHKSARLPLNQSNKNTEQQPNQKSSLTYDHLTTREFIIKLDSDPSCYSSLWQKFLQSVKQIQLNQQLLCLSHVCQKDRQQKLLNDFMKEMNYMLKNQDKTILEIELKIITIKDNELKHLYLQSHQLHVKLTQAKLLVKQHEKEYEKYLNALKLQQKERKEMLQSKRQFSLTRSHSNDSSPLRHLHKDLNINQSDLKQLMEKKSKLNLQLDLSFQIQQRKKISKQKEAFNAKKIKLEKEKLFIENKIIEIRQKIEIKEKQTKKYEFQKEKHVKGIQYFLKMLLKNPRYRLDGAMWIIKKMIEYGFEPQLSDFSDSLDINAKTFLMNEFNLMKQQQIFTLKPIEIKKKKLLMSAKPKSLHNRKRVKSVAVSNFQQQNLSSFKIKEYLNSNIPPNFNDDAFFSFGSKNLNPVHQSIKMRKKSGSLTLMKIYDESLEYTQQRKSKPQNPKASFRELTKQNNRNKLYFSTQKYIKSWISEKGWNLLTTKPTPQVEENRNQDKFINEEKARAKKKFFKIGRSNIRYNSIVETLYGSYEDLNAQSKRLKTSHQ